MPKMFLVLAFWTAVTGVMAMVGGMWPMALLFYGQTAFFLAVSFLNLSERVYIYIFGAYLTLFFVGFTYWSAFMMVPGGAE
ncbi:uncharacterized protein DUF2626 [Scopulibacillus darangshiensis]|uniref:Uncharacterized protein DUF2626 n=1 Tax=Scopulibacillus darangshiensis TaxID=442528 RepID=A0A4R2P9W8_9BACL|nr:DUF2626 domain-containing protein [Scopulibacillus darangshiensis]TCP31148.1 uncharacterized protein DUF2626 [Scopulibacillus darangshiensis]